MASLAWKPIPIRSPLPWALGRLWTLHGKGLLHLVRKNAERIYVLYDGDPITAWLKVTDPFLSNHPDIQQAFALQPRFTEIPYTPGSELLNHIAGDIENAIGPEPWRKFFIDILRDSIAHPVGQAEWWMFPSAFQLSKPPILSLPEFLWDFIQDSGPLYREYTEALGFSPIEYEKAMETLLRDSRLSPGFRQSVSNTIKLLPGRPPDSLYDQVFLSLFIAPSKSQSHQRTKTAPTPQIESSPSEPEPRCENPSQDAPIQLENFLERWDYLSAYAYQSKRWTHYRVLGLNEDADAESLKKRYRELSRNFHPDKWPDLDASRKRTLQMLFGRIQEAYEVLSDPAQREMYDRQLQEPGVQVIESKKGYHDPKRAAEYMKNALEALAKNNLTDAVRWMTSSIQIQPNPKLEAFIANLESQLPNLRQESMKRFEQLTQEFPQDPLTWWLFADALARWGFPKRSAEALQQAREIDFDLVDKLGPPGDQPIHKSPHLMKTLLKISKFRSL